MDSLPPLDGSSLQSEPVDSLKRPLSEITSQHEVGEDQMVEPALPLPPTDLGSSSDPNLGVEAVQPLENLPAPVLPVNIPMELQPQNGVHPFNLEPFLLDSVNLALPQFTNITFPDLGADISAIEDVENVMSNLPKLYEPEYQSEFVPQEMPSNFIPACEEHINRIELAGVELQRPTTQLYGKFTDAERIAVHRGVVKLVEADLGRPVTTHEAVMHFGKKCQTGRLPYDILNSLHATVALSRSRDQVLKFAIRAYHEDNHRGKWTTAEEAELLRLHEAHGPKWKKIGAVLKRFPKSVKEKYLALSLCKKSGRWSDEEIMRLEELCSDPKNRLKDGSYHWRLISKALDSRNPGQCREKWTVLRRSNSSFEFNPTEHLRRMADKMNQQGVDNERALDWSLVGEGICFNAADIRLLNSKWISYTGHIEGPLSERTRKVKFALVTRNLNSDEDVEISAIRRKIDSDIAHRVKVENVYRQPPVVIEPEKSTSEFPLTETPAGMTTPNLNDMVTQVEEEQLIDGIEPIPSHM